MNTVESETADNRRGKLLLWILGGGLLFPLFFQLSGRIYHNVNLVVDSGGDVQFLPLPVSLIVCYGGLLLLAPRYRQAALSLKGITAMVLAMALSLLLAGGKVEPRKVVLSVQVLLPLGGLVLGQMIRDEDQIIPRAFLAVLLITVPFQLLAGWVQGNVALTHHLYVFTIYQHFQFVPLIFICSFAYSMSLLWDTYKRTFIVLIPVMFIYALESLSFLTIIALVVFVCAFAWVRLKGYRKLLVILLISVVTAGIWAYPSLVQHHMGSNRSVKSQYIEKLKPLEQGEIPRNVTDRLADWKLYGSGIVESAQTILIGHPAPFQREVKTSAHNWYLDVAYNFGLLALLPIFFLGACTAWLLWQKREAVPTAVFWLTAIVFYLVILDNNMKVSLRQPYPGIFTFFLWGMLLSRLQGIQREHGSGC